jgi:hypothetical protein
LFLLLLIFMFGARVHAVLLARRVYASLSQLDRVRVDQTTEAELVNALPGLVKGSERGAVRTYSVEISNWPDHGWVIDPFRFPSPWYSASSPTRCVKPTSKKMAYWLGYRYFFFVADFVILDGRVSKSSYGFAFEDTACWASVGGHSVHGFWADRHLPVPVSSIDDQSPSFRVGGNGESLGATYAIDAPRKQVSHVFQLELGCLWSIGGCSSVREVAPALWQDRAAIEAATVSRLGSRNPCPDDMLAGRVRSLPDLNIELLEVMKSRGDGINNYEGDPVLCRITATDYRLIEVIRGSAGEPRIGIGYRNRIPAPLSVGESIWNPVRPPSQRGDRVLYFSGAKFQSCRVVSATPSALSAVRTAVAAPKRREDDLSSGWGRM